MLAYLHINNARVLYTNIKNCNNQHDVRVAICYFAKIELFDMLHYPSLNMTGYFKSFISFQLRITKNHDNTFNIKLFTIRYI
jgi:hypothetical protein